MAKKCKRLKGAKYEVIGGRHGDLETISDLFLKNGIYTAPKETKATTASKIDRVEQRLVGQFHAGKVYLPRTLLYRSEFDGKTHDFVQEYRLEYLQFPFGEHDDILDCHSQLFDGEFIQKGETSKEPKKEDRFEWWRKKAIEAHHPVRKRYVFGLKGYHRNEVPFTVGFDQ
jgi:hypothetical protein